MPFSYDLSALAEQIFFLRQPWLQTLESPKILLTGAAGWLGRYLLHMLTAQHGVGDIVAVAVGLPPAYLAMPRYQNVRYRQIGSRQELREIIATFRPHLILHADYVWDVYQQNLLKLYEINVGSTQTVCEAAVAAGVNRLLFFADATIYGSAAEPVDESAPPACQLPLSQSLYQAEQIAFSYHRPGQTEVYSLRVPALYGPGIPAGLMVLAYLMAEGALFGQPQHAPVQISTLSGYELALSAWLLALAPDPGHQIFHVSEGSVSLSTCLRHLSDSLPRTKIMGIPSRLAQIMKIGYQEEIILPQPIFAMLATLAQNTTDFFNQLRFAGKRPLLHPDVARYVVSLPNISAKRWHDTIGWQASPPLAWLSSVLTETSRQGWESVFPVARELREREEVEKTIAILDGVNGMVEAALNNHEEQISSWPLPLLPVEIDSKSLRLLIEEGWNQFLLALLKSETSEDFATLWPLWTSALGKEFLTIIRYEHSRAKRLFTDLSAQLKWLTQQLGALDLSKVRHYVICAGLSYLIRELGKWCEKYSDMAQLLPEKNYGIFLADERGDIALLLQVKAGRLKVSFPRQEVEALPRADYFARRLAEFKRELHLHVAVGGRLKHFFSDLFSEAPGKTFLSHLGSEYLIAENSEYYSLIGRTLHSSKKNLFFFGRTLEQVEFGVRSQEGRLCVLSQEEIFTVNRLVAAIHDVNQVVDMLREASQGRDLAVFLKIATVKKLLEGIVAPSRLSKVVLHILEKTAKKRDA
jgi:nucleoside-diphosphate-sugar epimerase